MYRQGEAWSAAPGRAVAFPDQASLRAGLPDPVGAETDFLALHVRWLGQRLADLAAEGSLSLEGADAATTLGALDGTGHVALTWTGLYGDSGSTCSSYYLAFTGEDRRALVACGRARAGDPFHRPCAEARGVCRQHRRRTDTRRDGMRRSSGPGRRPMSCSQPQSLHSARSAASTGWTGTSRGILA
jgi:hypothetical protein